MQRGRRPDLGGFKRAPLLGAALGIAGRVRRLQACNDDIDGPANGRAVSHWDLLAALHLDARIVHSAALQRRQQRLHAVHAGTKDIQIR